jgi:amino-acid N-acetyltransferase
LAQAKALYAHTRALTRSDATQRVEHQLATAIHACRNGVRRAHVLDRHVDGALVLELFTRDGIGTMVSADLYENTRPATIDDVGGILELIEPLEEDGTLVRRSREKLETEIGQFIVMERDGTAVACAAMYPFAQTGAVELACLALHKDYRNEGRGRALLEAVEQQARSQGMKQIFVLTTRAAHWFRECGFSSSTVDDLPVERKALYNYQRNSKVLVKRLD